MFSGDFPALDLGSRRRPTEWVVTEPPPVPGQTSQKARRRKAKASPIGIPFMNGERGEFTDSKGRPLKAEQIERIRLKREPKDATVEVLEAECEEGNVEYKLRLKDPNPMRLQQLITQLKYRLSEGDGEAYYYLGVEDNGYPKGLEPADLASSIATLTHMASSLGAVASVARYLRGAHGRRCAVVQVACDSVREVSYTDMRVAVAGSVDAGKSTLVAVLSHGSGGRPTLDSGRGSARMNVFRHKHEVESGRTSSISRQMVGYDPDGCVLNYGGEPALTPAEISAVASKLVTFIDMGGHAKHLKTALYGMTCLLPDYALLCVCCTSGLARISREHMALAVALDIPVAVVLTKSDLVGPRRLAAVVAEVRQMLALAQRAAAMGVLGAHAAAEGLDEASAPAAAADEEDASSPLVTTEEGAVAAARAVCRCSAAGAGKGSLQSVVPLIPVSCVTGSGLPVLHAFLATLLPAAALRNAAGSGAASDGAAAGGVEARQAAATAAADLTPPAVADDVDEVGGLADVLGGELFGDGADGAAGGGGGFSLEDDLMAALEVGVAGDDDGDDDGFGGFGAALGELPASIAGKQTQQQNHRARNGNGQVLSEAAPAAATTNTPALAATAASVGAGAGARGGGGEEMLFREDAPVHFQVDSTFEVEGVGPVVCGTVVQGVIRCGQQLMLGPTPDGGFTPVMVACIQRAHVPVKLAKAGHMCTIALCPFMEEGEEGEGAGAAAPAAEVVAVDAVAQVLLENGPNDGAAPVAAPVAASAAAGAIAAAPLEDSLAAILSGCRAVATTAGAPGSAAIATSAPSKAPAAACVSGSGGGCELDDLLLDELSLCCGDDDDDGALPGGADADAFFGFGADSAFGHDDAPVVAGHTTSTFTCRVAPTTTNNNTANSAPISDTALQERPSPGGGGKPPKAPSAAHNRNNNQQQHGAAAAAAPHVVHTSHVAAPTSPSQGSGGGGSNASSGTGMVSPGSQRSSDGVMRMGSRGHSPRCGMSGQHGLLGISTGVNQAGWYGVDPTTVAAHPHAMMMPGMRHSHSYSHTVNTHSHAHSMTASDLSASPGGASGAGGYLASSYSLTGTSPSGRGGGSGMMIMGGLIGGSSGGGGGHNTGGAHSWSHHHHGLMGLSTSPSSPALLMAACSPPNSRKGAVLLDASIQPHTSYEFEAVLVLLGGHWPARGLLTGRWPPTSAAATDAAEAAEAAGARNDTGAGTDTGTDAATAVGSGAASLLLSSCPGSASGSASDDCSAAAAGRRDTASPPMPPAAAAVGKTATGAGSVAAGESATGAVASFSRQAGKVKGGSKPKPRAGEFTFVVHCGSVRQTAKLVRMKELQQQGEQQQADGEGELQHAAAGAWHEEGVADVAADQSRHRHHRAASALLPPRPPRGPLTSTPATAAATAPPKGVSAVVMPLKPPASICAAAALLHSAQSAQAAGSNSSSAPEGESEEADSAGITRNSSANGITAAVNGEHGSSTVRRGAAAAAAGHSDDATGSSEDTGTPTTTTAAAAAASAIAASTDANGAGLRRAGSCKGRSKRVAAAAAPALDHAGCLAHVVLRFTQRPEWLREGAKLIVRDRADGHIAGAGYVRRML